MFNLENILRRSSTPSVRPDPEQCEVYRQWITQSFSDKERHLAGFVIDVGCADFAYARGVAAAFPTADLLGIEVQGERRYVNLFRRRDYAKAYALDAQTHAPAARPQFGMLRKVEFLENDFRLIPSLSDLPGFSHSGSPWIFLFFFPFVSPEPARAWGLPDSFAKFDELLQHAKTLAKAGGAQTLEILSVHQGDWELMAALEAYNEISGRFGETKPRVILAEEYHARPIRLIRKTVLLG